MLFAQHTKKKKKVNPKDINSKYVLLNNILVYHIIIIIKTLHQPFQRLFLLSINLQKQSRVMPVLYMAYAPFFL